MIICALIFSPNGNYISVQIGMRKTLKTPLTGMGNQERPPLYDGHFFLRRLFLVSRLLIFTAVCVCPQSFVAPLCLVSGGVTADSRVGVTPAVSHGRPLPAVQFRILREELQLGVLHGQSRQPFQPADAGEIMREQTPRDHATAEGERDYRE